MALAAVEGLIAIVLADAVNVGPGPVLAVLGALVYGAASARTLVVRAA